MKMSIDKKREEKGRYSIAALRAALAQAIRKAEAGSPVEITRRGEPVAVLLGRDEYERLVAPKGDFWARFQTFRSQNDLDELALDPDEIFGDVRDPSPGREVSW